MDLKRAIQAASLAMLTSFNCNLIAAEPTSSKESIVKPMLTEQHLFEQSYTSIKMNSAILGEERELLVHLPDDYESTNKDYPVLYLLDGKRHLPHAIAAESILQKESLMPSSIIVAITNNRGTRRRDLSSGKDKFLNFIKQEVFPLISYNYRTSKYRTLFGHSMAGAFTMDVLATQPEVFDNYIAASPVIQMNESELITKFKQFELAKAETGKSLYISFGNEKAEGKSATDALNEFVKLMDSKPTTRLNWHYEFMPKQAHMTTPYLTLYAGLSHVFFDYQIPSYSGFSDYNQRGGMKGLKLYFNKRSSKYSEPTEIPEVALRRLGFAIFDDGHEKEGLSILELNVKNHPDSFRALNALAQIYEDVSQVNKALAVYKRGLKLAEEKSSSNLAHFKRQIDRLNESRK